MRTVVVPIAMVGMLVVVPLGLGLLEAPGLRRVRRGWLGVAVPGAVSLLLPRGPVAATLAAVYLAGTLALALTALARLERRRSLAPAEIALLTALVTPAVAGLSLVAERAGYPLFGYSPGVLLLTVAHFHFAGFAAALVAGLVCRLAGSAATRLAAWTVPAGTALVATGFFLGEWVELAGAAVLTTGMWLVAWATWRTARPTTGDRLTRALLAVSAAVLVATMLLALDWALGEAAGVPHLSVTWMAATHGAANALGLLCGLIAWRRLASAPARTVTAPDPVGPGSAAAAAAPAAAAPATADLSSTGGRTRARAS